MDTAPGFLRSRSFRQFLFLLAAGILFTASFWDEIAPTLEVVIFGIGVTYLLIGLGPGLLRLPDRLTDTLLVLAGLVLIFLRPLLILGLRLLNLEGVFGFIPPLIALLLGLLLSGVIALTGRRPGLSTLDLALTALGLALAGAAAAELMAGPPPLEVAPEVLARERETFVRASLALGLNYLAFLAFFFFTVFMLAHFVLPVQTRRERDGVLHRLLTYLLGRHGPALFVKHGRVVESENDRLRRGPGLALVDRDSAIVLEPINPPAQRVAGRRSRAGRSLYGQLNRARRRADFGLGQWLDDLARLGLDALRWLLVVPRRVGRRLLRRLGLVKPRAGAEIAPLMARIRGPGLVFTSPDEKVLAALDLRWQSRSRANIKALTRDGIEVTASLTVHFVLDANVPDRAYAPRTRPPTFNPQSVFRAVYGAPVNARASDDELEVKAWTDLPAFVASDLFRDLIATETLDNLFRPTSDDDFPLTAFRQRFGERVKASPVLRERGLHVISANVGALTPHELVAAQRVESWRADWARRRTEILAGGDLQATRILQRARANAQYDMVKQLREIAQASGSRAVVALRLFQALETASADPSIRRLLPDETVQVLNAWMENLRDWFKP